MLTHDKSSPGLWPGELKKEKFKVQFFLTNFSMKFLKLLKFYENFEFLKKKMKF
jgi:hypothetical protein